MSSNKDRDLNVVQVDDYLDAFLQIVAFYQYLKYGIRDISLSEEELKLKYI